MNEAEIERVEIDLLLDTIHKRYGYDFGHYARASLHRRILHARSKLGYAHVADLIPAILRDESVGRALIAEFSITVTEMFRDPDFYRAVRLQVIPYLTTYPFFRAWVAGCATGEEVYSLAILLKEEGVYERAKIFATDFNDAALKRAQDGIYPLKDIQQYTLNYQKAGGRQSFADYYHAEYRSAILDSAIKPNITFANHNLVTDSDFGESQLIFCRNVLIYFDRALQNRVLRVLASSLGNGGFLCLGAKETIDYSEVADQFTVVDAAEKIYRKRPGKSSL
ncbi:MAG: protein-glutamate O-methyltransferase CheR [Anaerolineae bacterium]